uniref:Uncharacterized protein n=1 Tax=Romanomermis culicivorax TaxID=13658 RepID=A0A915KH35_ROMCU
MVTTGILAILAKLTAAPVSNPSGKDAIAGLVGAKFSTALSGKGFQHLGTTFDQVGPGLPPNSRCGRKSLCENKQCIP